MPWFDFKLSWSDTIKKKVCRYLLQRYLGQFLEEKLKLEQLNVDFYNGKGNVENVTLSSEALNEICESQGWDVEVTGGRIGSVTVNVPWNAPMKEDSYIEVGNLFISLKPMARQKDDDTGMLESMWSSMSSSMQLAQECLEKEGDVPLVPVNTIDGLERFAQLIDNVLNRVKAKFVDTTLRLEYLNEDSDYGVAIIIKIDKIEYENEAGGDPPDREDQYNDDDDAQDANNKQKAFLLSTYASHHLKMQGITFYTEEFRIYNPAKHGSQTSDNLLNSDIGSEQFRSAFSEIPDTSRSYLSTVQSQYEESENDESEESTVNDCGSELDVLSTEPIMFARMSSQQEIRMKMKQVENLPGPKVELEMTLGAITVFISPRQLHLITYLIDVLMYITPNVKPPASDAQMSNVTKEKQKEQDFDFFAQKFSSMSGVIGCSQQGWSSTVQDTIEEQLYRSTETNTTYPGISESVMSSNSSMTSSISSSATSLGSKSRRRGIDGDPNADISHFKLRIACIGIVLLHDDILVESDIMSPEPPLTNQSVLKLKTKAEEFFDVMDLNTNKAIGANDITKISKSIEDALEFHNLRLILTPIILEGEEHRNTSGTVLKCSISVARAELAEHLNDISIPLLKFVRDGTPGSLPSRPEMLINYKQTRPIIKTPNGKKLAPPKNEFNISCSPCEMDFDISILDRISALLYKEPFSVAHLKCNVPEQTHSATTSAYKSSKHESKTELKVDCTQFDFKLRFPIPDLRPIHDSQRIPWWSRNVRPDFLRLHLQQLNFIYTFPSSFVFQANQIYVFYYENEKAHRIELARTVMKEVSSRYTPSTIEYPVIKITIPSSKLLQDQQERMHVFSGEDTDSDPTSGESIKLSGFAKNESTPFSSKRVLRESETRHTKDDASTDPESFVIPGDNAEMSDFCDKAMKLSKLQIEVDLPVVSAQLKSKQFYEILYNRFNSDLLMWTPSAPFASMTSTGSTSTLTATLDNLRQAAEASLAGIGMMDSIYAPFAMCKSKINIESSSSNTNSDSETDSDNVFHSAYGKSRSKKPILANRTFVSLSSTSAFKLNIHQGILTMFAPVRDSQNHVIPGQLGEFVIKMNSAYLFSVSGYRGNRNIDYLCFNGKSAEMYHCGVIPIPSTNPPLRLIGSVLPDHMQSTLYPTPKNLTQQQVKGSPNRDMIALAIQVKKLPEQHIKRVRISAGLQLTTLRHNMARPQHIWLTQLMDMFDVSDYPIQGYKSSSVITEMHFHLWDCAIDYRPLYLPYRAVATLGTFMISSNLATQNSGCTLRFIAEDCTISLAPHVVPDVESVKEKSKYRTENKITVLPASDLVCVVELGLFETSLRFSDKVTSSFPKFDLRAAINDVHVRTCSDSAQALAKLLGYIAENGDLESKIEDEVQNDERRMSTTSLNFAAAEDDLLAVRNQQKAIVVPEEQQQRVNTLLNDAMEDCSHVPQTTGVIEDESADGVELFYFPDEANQIKNRKSFNSSEDVPYKTDAIKRRFTSDESINVEDAISMHGASFKDEPILPVQPYDTESVNTEMRDLLDFETSVMISLKPESENEMLDPLPQVKSDLGDVTKVGIDATGASNTKTTPQRKISSDTDDDFCFISEEEKPAYPFDDMSFVDDPVRIVDNHFASSSGKIDLLKAPSDFPMAVSRYTLCEMSVLWHIYGGRDFPEDTEHDKHNQSEPCVSISPSITFSHYNMSEAYKMGVSYSKGSPTMQFGSSQWSKLTWRTRGGPGRKHDVLMEINLNKVRFSHELYPNNTKQASRQVLLVTELEIRDKLAVSSINKFLYHPTVGVKSRGTQHMIVIKALHLRPDPVLVAQECCLRISMLPLRLNIDQDSLLFLVKFFNEMAGGDDLPTTDTKQQNTVAAYHPPVMMVELPEAAQELQARKMVNENLMLLLDKEHEPEPECEDNESCNLDAQSEAEASAPIYFRSIVFSPDVSIRLDYHGKRVEMTHGPIAGLLMGLGQLQCSEIVLKKIVYRHGILGVEKLIKFLVQEWLVDIKKRQLPKIISGVGPMYSLIQLFQGIIDLFWLPIEQYQKDGRIVRGLQRGAQSFAARTALAALEITTRFIHLLQITAETAFDMLSPGPPVRRSRGNRKGKRKRLHPPPQDIREGVIRAVEVVKEGVSETALQIVEMAAHEHDQKGAVGAVGAVLRQIPPTAVRPIVLATQATSNVLSGVKNQLVPDARMEAKQKWKDEEE